MRAGVRVALFALALVGLSLAGRAAPGLGQLREYVAAAGPAGLAVYIAGYVVLSLVFVPRPLISATGGAAFGPVAGIAAAVAGSVAAAWVQFAVGRFLARDAVAARLPAGVLARLDRLTERHGLLAVIQLRLVPVIPFAAVNYGFGLTGLRAVPFVVGTALGSVPGTTAVVLLGDSLTDPGSPAFLASIALFLVLLLVSVFWGRGSLRAAGGGPEDRGEAEA
ncbi:TVP38/TMEM64 family protein [Nocardiopsis coralliicola]